MLGYPYIFNIGQSAGKSLVYKVAINKLIDPSTTTRQDPELCKEFLHWINI